MTWELSGISLVTPLAPPILTLFPIFKCPEIPACPPIAVLLPIVVLLFLRSPDRSEAFLCKDAGQHTDWTAYLKYFRPET